MSLKQRLMEKKASITASWRDTALAVPAGARFDFLEKQRSIVDAMGSGLVQGMSGLFDALLQGGIPNDVSRFLDIMVRIRASNDFTASQAVTFLIEVKKIIRRELGSDGLADAPLREELSAWDSAVDDLVLFAFDLYARSRENVLDANAAEESRKTLLLLKKAKLLPDDEL